MRDSETQHVEEGGKKNLIFFFFSSSFTLYHRPLQLTQSSANQPLLLPPFIFIFPLSPARRSLSLLSARCRHRSRSPPLSTALPTSLCRSLPLSSANVTSGTSMLIFVYLLIFEKIVYNLPNLICKYLFITLVSNLIRWIHELRFEKIADFDDFWYSGKSQPLVFY